MNEAARKKALEKGISPLDYLLSVMRDAKIDRSARVDAAKAAAPYVHARLSSVDVKNSDGSLKPEPVQDGVLGALARIHERE
jgi:succinate dehydrogenase/fumarate reductase-like Fe-S protein